MKRYLLLLAVMIFISFSFAIAQDAGVPDTLKLKIAIGDNIFNAPGPDFVKVPLYVTHDVVTDTIDSLAGIVIPLCYTHSNPAKYCSLSAYWNQPAITSVRSVFRDVDGQSSWTKEYYGDGSTLMEWDTRVLNLDGFSHFWLSMIASGAEDQRLGDVGNKLHAVMTFKIEDSMTICIDSCFWPPSSRLAFTNSKAVSYYPKIWDDYNGEVFCDSIYIPPDLPPVVACPGTPPAYNTSGAKTLPGVDATDPDDVVASLVATYLGPGAGVSGVTLTGVAGLGSNHATATLSFTIDHCLPGGTIEVIATDGFGMKDTCWTVISTANANPTINAGGDKVGAYNAPIYSDVVTTADGDGDVVTWAITGISPTDPGTIVKDGNKVKFTPGCSDVDVVYTITLTASDICQATGTDDLTMKATNSAPTCAFEMGGFMGTDDVRTVAFTYSDPEGAATVTSVVGGAGVSNISFAGGVGTFDYTAPSGEGTFTVTLTVTDECGLFHECSDEVEVRAGLPNQVNIGTINCVNPGDFVEVPISLVSPDQEFGGFELEVEFDYTTMTFVGARRGELIPEECFEKFTYRLLPCPACGCCKYKILLFGMYDLPNMVLGCPIPMEDGVLVYLQFVVNNDENLRGFTIPVCWEWEGDLDLTADPDTLTRDWDCAENTFSSVDGNDLKVSTLDCQYNDLPECDAPGFILEVMNFQAFNDGSEVDCYHVCGGVVICPPSSTECKRGDVNNNTMPYEVADAVLFASYFVDGLSVFSEVEQEREYQICATDVNADGRTLTLSDLVYLIRVILRDAVEIPKPAPSSEVASVITYNGTITTECNAPIGAILFEFESAVSPTLLASNMEMKHNGSKVLVWSQSGNAIEAASQVLSVGDVKLVSVSAVDRNGSELKTTVIAKVAPSTFALNPAYPNPFNPTVNLSFTLPEAANYKLAVYNVAGQLVRSFEAMGTVGLNTVTWDGKDNTGNEVSSGVYFYKLTAAGFSATEKMVMMK